MAEVGIEPCAVCAAPIHLARGKWMFRFKDGRKVRICRKCDHSGAWRAAGLQDDAPLTNATGVPYKAPTPMNRWRRPPDAEPAEKKETTMARTFTCVDCKKESECAPTGLLPKRCAGCNEIHKTAAAKERYAAKHGKGKRGGRTYKVARVSAKTQRTGGGEIGELLDARIREVVGQSLALDLTMLEQAVVTMLPRVLEPLVDARIRAVFSGRAKA